MDNRWRRFFGGTPLARTFTEEWSPTADISETKDNFIIKGDLAGMDEKDVTVSISENVLTIKGEKKKEEEKRKTSIIISVRDAMGLSNAHSSCQRCAG